MNQLDKLLEPYRGSGNDLGVVTVIDDTQAKKILAAWTRYNAKWVKPRGRRPSNPDDLWYWLWEGVDFEPTTLASMANVSPHVVASKFEVLVHARLVFPDGTISKQARQLLEVFISENMPKPKPPSKPAAKAKVPTKRKPAAKKKGK